MFVRRIALTAAFGLLPLTSFAIFGNPSSVTVAFNYVGEIGSVDGGGAFSFGASAVAIDPHWILTARHVDGNAFRMDGTVYHAVSGQDFAADNTDLRLIKINVAMPAWATLAKFDALGMTAKLVGYGGSGTGISGNAYNVGGVDGQRHAANNNLDAMEQVAFSADQTPWNCYRYDLDDPNGTGNGYTTGEGGVWFGDSGGGWFVNGPSGVQLVAVSCAVFNPAFPDGGHENEFGSFGYGTKIADSFDFIGQHVPGAVPEPATMAGLGLGMLALLKARRRR